MLRRVAAGAIVGASLVLSGCASAPVPAPFTTDGCSLFPDRAPAGQADWCGCCVAHDLAYWRGGSAAERLESDRVFRQCVRAASRSPALAGTMYGAVRAGGVPWLPSPFRWGYGWDYGRLYRTLSLEEDAQATALRAAYLSNGTAAVCKP
ncbi:hypothetical protein LK540_04775 [Massilia sp. IC2-278]|uniref:hypothetical protein n=1 Tax=Massilia sp. IC2-278 TaxID=2887200 RepID=UPI001E5C076A|nr:hypothetical protein [Massilia sp. IC2-278]MCC2959744.1 hypothetical protein [Massilia sp. IC2-278]